MGDTKISEAWPDYLMIRDTKLHDDAGGLGQRIFTTAGAGYEKVKYVRADLAHLQGEAVAAAWMDPDGSRVLTAKAKENASGACRSATAGYTVPLYTHPQPAELAEQQGAQVPFAWVTESCKQVVPNDPRSLHVNGLSKQSGDYNVPLYLAPPAQGIDLGQPLRDLVAAAKFMRDRVVETRGVKCMDDLDFAIAKAKSALIGQRDAAPDEEEKDHSLPSM